MPYTNPASYEAFMGRWSRKLAPDFIAFAGVGPAERVLDVGCGTGILTQALLDLTPNVQVVGIDPDRIVPRLREAVCSLATRVFRERRGGQFAVCRHVI